ncbi:MAG: DHHW family protein [Oscillospiraceae bacterium]|nr:DHHW family protein [Oscillospiraceae bacterium]
MKKALVLLALFLLLCGCSSQQTVSNSIPDPAVTSAETQVCTTCDTIPQTTPEDETEPAATDTTTPASDPSDETVPLTGSADPVSNIDETVTGIHYHNNLSAYYSGNVLVCGDYALEYFSMSKSGCADWAAAVNAFAARFPAVHVSALLVPKCCAFHAPAGFDNQYDNQAAYISATYAQLQDGITAVDAASLLAEHSGEYLYYRTDHHWTSLGAYYASAAYCRAVGITPRQLSSYETTVQTGYVGSLYSFCTEPPACLKTNPDYTVCHLPLAEYEMTYDNGSGFLDGLALNTETNAYASAFLGGDNALTKITTNNQTGRRLLIFKESYGNAFVPYMIDYYDEIIVVDIREDTDSVASIIANYGITDALVINNVQASESLPADLAAKLAS